MKHIKLFEQFVNEADDVLKEANKLLRKLKWGRNDLKSEYTNAANKYDARKNGVMNKGEFLDALAKALNKNGLSDLITNLREDKYGDPEGDLGKFVIMMNASWDGEIAIAYGDYIIARTAGLRPGAPIYAPTPEATIDMYIDILKSSRDVLEEIKNL